MGFLSFLFGNRDKKIQAYLNRGAIILDVRTLEEYRNGHIDGSKHIPLNELNRRVEELKQMDKPLIVCCASGVRSAKAAKFLTLNNLDAINGGGWKSLERKL
ncbi:MAG: rhodanese-like domain-containing protein [Algicola sp.]|nr:rhodanese-like domain-containing protein [Algicola sp.]